MPLSRASWSLAVALGALGTIAGACDDGETDGVGAAGSSVATTARTATSDASTQTSSNASSTSSGFGGESPGPERAPGMTDLSILFPLPADDAEMDLLIAADDVGVGGEVLPFATFQTLPDLSFFFEDDAAQYAALRVVSARIDPCFGGGVDAPCRRQVRLVLQPIQDQGAGLVGIDAAVHLFFELDVPAFAGLVGDLTRAQSAADAEGPLRVHPAMTREGLGGAATAAIRRALLARIGATRMSRVTFMQLTGHADVWVFGGYDVDAGGAMTPVAIAGSAVTTQTFSNDAEPDPKDFHGGVDPVVPPDDLSAFYESDVAHTQTDDDLWPAYEAALRVQNPTVRTSESVSCVACHTAHAALAWADANTELETRASASRFTSPLDLTPPSDVYATSSQVVRAFGYHDAIPSVSHRTIFETAIVVEATRAAFGF